MSGNSIFQIILNYLDSVMTSTYSMFVKLRITSMDPCCDSQAASVATLEVDADDLALLCKALGHPARVRLLKYLSAYGACYFGNLTEVVPLAASTISQHVTVLKQAGLILASSDEQRTCYCVNPERLTQLKQLIGGL